jgi:hypothetical protein
MAIDAETDPNIAACADEMTLNRWPINGMAEKMLRELGETPDPASMYLLQLASWAVKTGKTEAENDVGETVNAMTEWRPERIMNFFLLHEAGQEYDPPGWTEAKTPLDLALILLDDIERKMVMHFPWYRSLNW